MITPMTQPKLYSHNGRLSNNGGEL